MAAFPVIDQSGQGSVGTHSSGASRHMGTAGHYPCPHSPLQLLQHCWGQSLGLQLHYWTHQPVVLSVVLGRTVTWDSSSQSWTLSETQHKQWTISKRLFWTVPFPPFIWRLEQDSSGQTGLAGHALVNLLGIVEPLPATAPPLAFFLLLLHCSPFLSLSWCQPVWCVSHHTWAALGGWFEQAVLPSFLPASARSWSLAPWV